MGRINSMLIKTAMQSMQWWCILHGEICKFVEWCGVVGGEVGGMGVGWDGSYIVWGGVGVVVGRVGWHVYYHYTTYNVQSTLCNGQWTLYCA